MLSEECQLATSLERKRMIFHVFKKKLKGIPFIYDSHIVLYKLKQRNPSMKYFHPQIDKHLLNLRQKTTQNPPHLSFHIFECLVKNSQSISLDDQRRTKNQMPSPEDCTSLLGPYLSHPRSFSQCTRISAPTLGLRRANSFWWLFNG